LGRVYSEGTFQVYDFKAKQVMKSWSV
jgi:hypothetical protein